MSYFYEPSKKQRFQSANFTYTCQSDQRAFRSKYCFCKMGGTIDFTASEDPDFWEKEDDEVRFSKGLKRLLAEGIGLDQFTMTSDGQGSLPYFDENNQFIGLGVGSSRALMVGIKEAVQKSRFHWRSPFEQSLLIQRKY